LPPRSDRRKQLSQNLLRDDAAIELYLAAVPAVGLAGIEVGAGDGALTARLAALLPELTAYELDPELVARARCRVSALATVRVVQEDFLSARPLDEPFVLVGNAPFGITTAILDWALAAPRLSSATLITHDLAVVGLGAGRPDWPASLSPGAGRGRGHPPPHPPA
jgi:23S rRNA (adenine-N6)-dimethyltransferase